MTGLVNHLPPRIPNLPTSVCSQSAHQEELSTTPPPSPGRLPPQASVSGLTWPVVDFAVVSPSPRLGSGT